MAADSVTISYLDTSYTFSIKDGPPAALDTVEGFQEMLKDYLHNINPEQPAEDTYAWTIVGFLIVMVLLGRLISKWATTEDKITPATAPPAPENNYHMLAGRQLHFERPVLHNVLTRYFFYYQNLCHTEQSRFLLRLQNFIAAKTFIIPAAEAYREMPILISASAIQLTFGLKEYMLPWFHNICVHPHEYILDNPLRTLAGNVCGNTITLSWKHFLSDYQRRDGVNVGLHEMAHALQMQCEYFYKRKGRDFRLAYDLLESIDGEVIAMEKTATEHFYSSYALTNTDEFWASSVELFFERPTQLKDVYPQVHNVLRSLLRQDLTESESNPCIAHS